MLQELFIEKVKEVLERMKYHHFWHHDHERKCDVVCVSFSKRDSIKLLKSWGVEKLEALMREESKNADVCVEWLKSKGVNAYVHYGPTGSRFVAVDTKDKVKLESIVSA